MKRISFWVTMVFLAGILLTAGCSSGDKKENKDSQKVSYPERKIDVVVGYSAGGGTDIFARTVTKILNEEKIVSQPFVITNKPGAAGALALTQVASRKGDPYTLLILPSLGTPILTGEAKVEYSDFIPLARLVAESNIIVASTESNYKTFDDLVKDVKARPGKVKAGGTSAIGMEAFQWYSLGKLIGSEFNYIPFNSGSEAAAALLGGKIDVLLSNPSEGLDQVKAGKWRALVALSDERMKYLPDVPTAKELGVDFSWYMDRSVWAPAGVPDDVVAFWDDAFKKLDATDAWRDYVDKNMVLDEYLNSTGYKAYLPPAVERYEAFLREVNALK